MGIFNFFSRHKNGAHTQAPASNPWSNTSSSAKGNEANNGYTPKDQIEGSSALNATSTSNTNASLINGHKAAFNGPDQANSQIINTAANPNQNHNSAPKEITGNGEAIILGYGYASSYELSKRGYRDGITVQTLSDMNEGVSLVLAEYQAHLDKEIQRYEDEKDTCLRILARSGNICQQLDDQYDEIIHSQQRKIAKYEAYKLEVQKPEGQAAAIVTAYKRGYQAGVGKHRLYLTDTANPNKAD
jgi:hypothetical protein